MRLPALFVLFCSVALSGCVNQTVNSNSVPALERSAQPLPEDLLLDVGIAIFDPGLDDLPEDEDEARLVYPEVRKAESHFMASRLAETMQNSGVWGAVRVLPGDQQVVDLMVEGKILHSDGEKLTVHVKATDARGHNWLDDEYSDTSSAYAYRVTTRNTYDPFQSLYNRIANDLVKVLNETPNQALANIRTTAELRFAAEFSPDAFGNYLEPDKKGRQQIVRLPAEGDPMIERIRRIRERDRIYIDTLQDYYANFDDLMRTPYQEWRKLSYEETIALRELEEQARTQLLTGGLAIVAGILAAASDGGGTSGDITRTAGWVAISGGGLLLKQGLEIRQEAQIQVEALEELGLSLEEEIAPQVIELEDRTVTLSGSVEEQYAQWRAVLDDIYEAEIGSLAPPPETAQGTDTL